MFSQQYIAAAPPLPRFPICLPEELTQPDAVASGVAFAWEWLESELGHLPVPTRSVFKRLQWAGLIDAGANYWFNHAVRIVVANVLEDLGVDCSDMAMMKTLPCPPGIPTSDKVLVCESYLDPAQITVDPPIVIFNPTDPMRLRGLPVYDGQPPDVRDIIAATRPVPPGSFLLNRLQPLGLEISLYQISEDIVEVRTCKSPDVSLLTTQELAVHIAGEF